LGCTEDEVTGNVKLMRKNKHSLSLSPIRNTLAQFKDRYINDCLKNNSKISKYASNQFDSTQESLNIEAYMQNNSTMAIEEVDEDDPDYSYANVKTIKSSDLRSISDSSK